MFYKANTFITIHRVLVDSYGFISSKVQAASIYKHAKKAATKSLGEAGVETMEWIAFTLTVTIMMITIGELWQRYGMGDDVAESIRRYFEEAIQNLTLEDGEI